MKAALELHKDILQGLQTVDAFSQDMFLPEELDLHLNRMQDSFVNELLDKGFADRQLRLDYIQDLIVKNKPLNVFVSPTSFYYENGAVNSFLPGNYKHLLATRTGVRRTDNCATVEEATEEVSKYFTTLKLSTESTTVPYYNKVEIVKVETDQSRTVVATTSTPILDAADTYLIVRNLLFDANAKFIDVEFYWEKYTDTERQGNIEANSFIIVSDRDTVYELIVYAIDDTAESTVIGVPIEQKIEFYTDVILNGDADADPVIEGLEPLFWTSTTLLDNKELYDRRQNIFFFPKAHNPHTALADGILFNYYSGDYIIEKVKIDYIREPQPISLEADQGCELSISGANIIVNRVVEYLKLAIENPIYRDVLQHNEIRDQK